MTISLWVSILVAIIAGLFGGIVGPIVNDKLSHSRWRSQKSFELKYEAFRGAVDTLAAWEADALNFELQRNKSEYKRTTREVEVRPSTAQALEHYKSLMQAMFSSGVASAYDTTLRSHIAIENVPNTDFEQNRASFVTAAASELGLLKNA